MVGLSHVVYLKFKFSWVSYILSGSSDYRATFVSLSVLSFSRIKYAISLLSLIFPMSFGASAHNLASESLVSSDLILPEYP